MTEQVRVLIADKLSPAAVDIFRNRGVDFDIKVGLSKDELIAVIGEYDGVAIRSGAKLDKDVILSPHDEKEVRKMLPYGRP